MAIALIVAIAAMSSPAEAAGEGQGVATAVITYSGISTPLEPPHPSCVRGAPTSFDLDMNEVVNFTATAADGSPVSYRGPIHVVASGASACEDTIGTYAQDSAVPGSGDAVFQGGGSGSSSAGVPPLAGSESTWSSTFTGTLKRINGKVVLVVTETVTITEKVYVAFIPVYTKQATTTTVKIGDAIFAPTAGDGLSTRITQAAVLFLLTRFGVF